MDKFPALKVETEDIEIQYQVVDALYDDARKKAISDGMVAVSEKLSKNQSSIDELDLDIERLTSHADGIDYAVAVSCGIIAGLIDSIFVGEWNFANAKAASNEKVNRKVIEFAKKQGYDGDRLDGAIRFLEKKYPLPGDGAWAGSGINLDVVNDKNIGDEIAKKLLDSEVTAKTHHLDDFCHHPTLVGLICCVIVQFTGTTIYSDKTGTHIDLPIIVNDYGNFVGKNPVTKMFAGVINWFITVAKTIANRKGHLLSDIAGTSKTAGKGMGLPGTLLSTLKELSALPILKDTNFPENLRKAFHNGIGPGKSQIDLGAFNSLFEGASSRFDMRTEMAIAHELKRQALPVVINEVLVRGLYFIRRFIVELKAKERLSEIEWRNVLPFNNRTITRMLTIATGTFTAVDLIDAGIRGAIKSGGNAALFAKSFVLRVNFVGIGRFTIAVFADTKMGMERTNYRNKRIVLFNEQLHLMNAKVFYGQANAWIAAEETGKTLNEAMEACRQAFIYFANTVAENKSMMEGIDYERIKEKNSELLARFESIDKWGEL